LLVDEFKRRYERPSDHEVRAMATTARERDRRSVPSRRLSDALLTPRTVIVLALVVIVAALYVIGNQNGKTPSGSGNKITPATNTTHHDGHGRDRNHAGATTTNTNTDTTGTSTTPAPPKLASLKLVPTTTVWICVENQAGKALMTAGDFSVGQTVPSFRARQLLVTLGNAGVTMTADGKAYTPTVPSGSAAIALRITPTAVRPLSSAPTCGQ
jgi:hypothetical protein